MRGLRAWMARFAGLFRRRRRERELAAELESHLALHIEDNLRAGMAPEEARRQALVKLGGLEQARDRYREQSGIPLLETAARDLRYGARILRKAPGFTAVAVLTLALGIGANTALFSIVESVLLRPLPFKDPARLVLLAESNPGKVDRAGVPYPDYVVWKSRSTAFEETAAYWETGAVNDIVVGGAGSAERAQYSVVTNSFFPMLGVETAIGHGFTAEDEKPGGPKRFLASDALWHRVLGGSSGAVGMPFLLDGEVYTLAGVLPPRFDFPEGCDVWLPVGALGDRGMNDRVSHPFRILGRLKRGVRLWQALAQINAIQARLAQAYPKTDAGWRAQGRPLLEEFVGSVRAPLLVLLAAAGFILLIACVNVANLLLARASAREREFTIRAVLGASRLRLARQAFSESLLIVALGAIVALVLATFGVRAIAALSAGRIARLEAFQWNAPVLLFAAAIALLTTLLVGMAPALQLSSTQFSRSLAEGQRGGGAGMRSRRLRNVLVVCEVALTLPLLCGAGLMLKSLDEWNRVDPGFRPDHVVILKIALPSAEYPRSQQSIVFLDRLLERLRAVPGVQSAAAANFVPLSGQSDWGSFQIAGRSSLDWSQALSTEVRSISPNYFQTMGIPLLRGREFTDQDERDRAAAIVINQAAARKFWPGADPIGKRIVDLDNRLRSKEIIGIVGDVKSFGLDAASPPEMYGLYGGWWYMNVVLRSNASPASLFSAVRGAVARLDKSVAVYGLSTMDELLARSVAPRRFNLFLLGLFAVLALVLVMVGIYGVMSYAVSMRTHEIGIRMALGAGRQEIIRMTLRRGASLALAGVAFGIAGALLLTRLMASLLFGVGASDPATFAGAAALLAAVVLGASYMPARRASKMDPAFALRHE